MHPSVPTLQTPVAVNHQSSVPLLPYHTLYLLAPSAWAIIKHPLLQSDNHHSHRLPRHLISRRTLSPTRQHTARARSHTSPAAVPVPVPGCLDSPAHNTLKRPQSTASTRAAPADKATPFDVQDSQSAVTDRALLSVLCATRLGHVPTIALSSCAHPRGRGRRTSLALP